MLRVDSAYIPPQSRLNWSKASADDKSTCMDKCAELLGSIELPQNDVCCSNTPCKDVSHIEGTKDLYCCIVNALHTAALNVIPVTRASSTTDDHNIPGRIILLKQRTLMLGTHLSSGLDLVNPGRARCLILCEFPELKFK